MRYQATQGKVIVEVLEQENITGSGLYLVRNNKQRPLRGRVISVGRDRVGPKNRIFKAPCKVGDIVHYKKGTAFRITSRFSDQWLSTVYFGDIKGIQRGDYLHATYDNIIVQVFYKDTSDLIYIPDKFQKRISAFVGYVKSIGPDYPHELLGLNAGDAILFPRDEGFPIVIKDEVFHSLYPEHVKARVDCPLDQLHEVLA